MKGKAKITQNKLDNSANSQGSDYLHIGRLKLNKPLSSTMVMLVGYLHSDSIMIINRPVTEGILAGYQIRMRYADPYEWQLHKETPIPIVFIVISCYIL